MFDLRLKRSSWASQSDIANLVNKTDFDNKLKDVTSNKNELNELSKKVKAISTKVFTKDLISKLSVPNGTKYYSLGIFQNYLVFIPAKKYIKYFTGTACVDLWKSGGIPEESFDNLTKSDSNFAPTFVDHHLLPDRSSNKKIIFLSLKKVINPYISYTLGPQLGNSNSDFILGNCLFGSVKLTKNADPDKYKYTGYSIGFDSRSEFLFTDGSYGKNGIIFWADMVSAVRVDNEGKDL